MKVRAITLNNGRYTINSDNYGIRRRYPMLSNSPEISDLNTMPYYAPISFGIQNSSKLRDLFAYDLPCMYSGIKMINPKDLTRYIKNGSFACSSKDAVKILERHSESICGIEEKVFQILRGRAKIHPEKNLQELIKEIEPIYRRRLRKRQAPIFHEISDIFKDLPVQYRKKFDTLMYETNKKLDEKPVILPFSTVEFKYKLFKIKDFVLSGQDIKAKKVINVMMRETRKFADSTNPKTIANQRQVIGRLDWILKKSVLKNNDQLRDLINASKSRLFYEEVIVPFSRKSFIYDLLKIIKPLNNSKLEDKVLKIASRLPTSSNSLSAYILKLSAEPPEKIGYRILRPTTASVEHILPKSCGGADDMSNFGGATAYINSARKSIELDKWAIIHPEVRDNCQKYVNRLIELYHKGIFRKHNISPRYIYDFKKTVEKQSKGIIKLDISQI